MQNLRQGGGGHYTNGTSSVKCLGPRACHSLSASFIKNNIGCGSCNSYGACIGLTGEFLTAVISVVSSVRSNNMFCSFKNHAETSAVGEGSCNGWNVCRYDKSLSEITLVLWDLIFMKVLIMLAFSFISAESNATSSTTIADQIGNEYYSCSYFLGEKYCSFSMHVPHILTFPLIYYAHQMQRKWIMKRVMGCMEGMKTGLLSFDYLLQSKYHYHTGISYLVEDLC